MTRRARTDLLGLGLFILLVAADQISKLLIQANVRFHRGIPVIGDFLRITHVLNSGGAFSTRFGGVVFYITAAAVAMILIVVYLLLGKEQRPAVRISLFVTLSGAAGNLVDRIRLGKVVDWIDIGIGNTRWPTFNVADAAIVIGLLILILAGSKDERESGENNGSEGDRADAAGPLPGGDGDRSEPHPDSEADSEEEDRGNRQGG